MINKMKQQIWTIIFSPFIFIWGVHYVIKEVATVWWYDFKQSFRGVKK